MNQLRKHSSVLSSYIIFFSSCPEGVRRELVKVSLEIKIHCVCHMLLVCLSSKPTGKRASESAMSLLFLSLYWLVTMLLSLLSVTGYLDKNLFIKLFSLSDKNEIFMSFFGIYIFFLKNKNTVFISLNGFISGP